MRKPSNAKPLNVAKLCYAETNGRAILIPFFSSIPYSHSNAQAHTCLPFLSDVFSFLIFFFIFVYLVSFFNRSVIDGHKTTRRTDISNVPNQFFQPENHKSRRYDANCRRLVCSLVLRVLFFVFVTHHTRQVFVSFTLFKLENKQKGLRLHQLNTNVPHKRIRKTNNFLI